ncbi:GGDEF domain-containing protein [Paenibacillus methanolicus]|uniref:Diguanylate cyclase (GGDEF)-like protein n=1 Tax=Paenibacillus methanolicus TaxID=582686 RepID=A0A5S5C6Y9_9BACL|nr:GGDEF domain-containing protein [Paenibacillus methanolicus]TYP73743.1 diguanylate cyclase (GGDEF)-like protein [Paenibacillus methanolicus]
MTTPHWLAGPGGQSFASASVVTIVALMLFMAIRLHRMYKRNGVYRLLIGVLAAIFAQYGFLLSQSASDLSGYPDLLILQSLLSLLSFIIINFVFMKLYTQPSSRLKGMPFLVLGAGALIAAGAGLSIEPAAIAESGNVPFYGTVALDLYGLVVISAIMLSSRGIEQRMPYSASLIVYLIYHVVGLAERYLFHGEVALTAFVYNWLPAIYYTLLFVLLFEWVVERLVTTFHSSITDGLTSLYNRKHFQKKADSAMREQGQIAIIFCDIDNFKRLNDTHGHHKADGVLKQIAEILKEETSGIGAAGRYGGEELLALISAPGANAEQVAETIRSRVEKETIVTVSVGVSAGSGCPVLDVVKQADEAMYQSKTTGKNKVSLHPNMPKLTKSRSRAKPQSAKRKAAGDSE